MTTVLELRKPLSYQDLSAQLSAFWLYRIHQHNGNEPSVPRLDDLWQTTLFGWMDLFGDLGFLLLGLSLGVLY